MTEVELCLQHECHMLRRGDPRIVAGDPDVVSDRHECPHEIGGPPCFQEHSLLLSQGLRNARENGVFLESSQLQSGHEFLLYAASSAAGITITTIKVLVNDVCGFSGVRHLYRADTGCHHGVVVTSWIERISDKQHVSSRE